jgi:ABC-2 type transport system ATP-binding protein
MKQRLALARALLHRPDLLFLDEPTAGLDPVASRRVHDMIGRISREEGRTVLLCTHNLAEAQKLCDRVAVLENGRLVGLGTPLALAQRLGRAQRLEIEVAREDLPTALSIVQSTGGLREIEHQDAVITALGADREMIADLIASLAAAGVRMYRVFPQEPSLEDIYFALYETQERAV